MADWVIPDQDSERLDLIVAALEEAVADDPAFEDLTGLDVGELARHAAKAVLSYFSSHHASSGPDMLVHLYCTGFVVGVRYQQQREKDSP